MPEFPFIQTPRPAWLILACGAVFCLSACRKEPVTASPGRAVVMDSLSKRVDRDALQAMRWEDIGPTAESCARHDLTEPTLEAAKDLSTPPVIYLRGLLKFTLNDTDGAAGEWAKIDVAVIPPDHLYAPWRLSSSRKDARNRYEAALTKAVEETRASPLVRARFLAARCHWREALDAYLLTDPANWSTYEIKTFAAMKLHAPSTHDVEVLMAGALAGGQVPDGLKLDMARLIKSNPVPDREALAGALRSDPEFAKAATKGMAESLALRQAFASDRYQDVIGKVRSADPLQATDETVLLAFLSAARVKDHPVMETWAAELLRRAPNPKTREWIARIRAEAR